MSPVSPPIEQFQDSVLYFSHIPKTAGTSFTAIIDRFFPVDHIFPAQLWWDVGSVQAARRAKHQLIRGHFGVAAALLSEAPLQTITLLREPMALAFSAYQYAKRETNTAVHDLVVNQGMTFEQFLTDDQTRNLTRNRLIKSLTFGWDVDLQNTDITIETKNYRATKRLWNQSRKQWSADDWLAQSMQLLEGGLWFGLVEAFDWSLLMLCHQLSWPPIGPTAKLNRHPEGAEISPQAKAIFQSNNASDLAFYDCAKMKFEQRKAVFCEALGVNSDDFEAAELKVDKHYRKQSIWARQSPKKHALNYDFSQSLLGQNWHDREWSEAHQSHFRWTGPDTDTVIDFWLAPGRYRLQLHYVNVVSDDFWSDLSLSVNDHELNWALDHHQQHGTLTLDIEPHMTNESGLIRLKITNQLMARHHDVFQTDDHRMVGLAVTQITMTAA
ncbi:hypothetical protein [Marinicella meishanensis]|uniref:hypothetical protein n=1 Tax=Marinicella meishanensis TaxID=2873263 RepID=UPI001CC11C3E|nr:hypothetical protein [Marinicella sp. NBU2979]